MSICRGELAGRILRILNKTSKNPGFYTAEKVFDAIQESMDFVAMEMFIADHGWLTKMKFIDTLPNQVTIPITTDMSMIKEVRYLLGDTYCPLAYDDATNQPMYNSSSGVAQYAYRYKVVDNQFYFNPILAEGGPRFLQVEYVSFPRLTQDDGDEIEPQFNACMDHFMKYRAATVLSASMGKGQCEWAGLEAQWQQKLVTMVNRRNMQSIAIREFCP